MVEFAYKATDPAGKIFEGSMEGRDEKMVVESLQKLGYLPIRITAIQARAGIFKLPISAYLERITTNDLLVFTQELSTLLEAGLPLDRSLQILTELTEKERFREVVRDILKKIEAGRVVESQRGSDDGPGAVESHPGGGDSLDGGVCLQGDGSGRQDLRRFDGGER